MARTRDIWLHEYVRPDLIIVPGSISTDIDKITQEQIADFPESHQIVAEIGELRSTEGRFVKFDIRSDCLEPDSPEESIQVDVDRDESIVTYTFGLYSGEVDVPPGTFECLRPGALKCKKKYLADKSRLEIEVISMYSPFGEDKTIRDVTISEQPSIYFQADLATASPTPAFVFPQRRTDMLVWKIPQLKAGESKVLSVHLEPTVCSDQYTPPIEVNAGKYTGDFFPWAIRYTLPTGTPMRAKLPLVGTSLPLVESCSGRPDLFIDPAYTFNEYEVGLTIQPKCVLPCHESTDIWVDSPLDNGTWNGLATNVGDYIQGARLEVPGSPIARSIQVEGQGDIFQPAATTNVIFSRVANLGQIQAPSAPDGVTLDLYDFRESRWDKVLVQPSPVVDVDPVADYQNRRLVKFVVPRQKVQDVHMRPYALSINDGLRVIESLNSTLAARIRAWATNNPVGWASLEGKGEIAPSDLTDAFQPGSSIRSQYEGFLAQYAGQMAWGKQSIKVRVIFKPAVLEKHTNNNTSTEVILVSP